MCRTRVLLPVRQQRADFNVDVHVEALSQDRHVVAIVLSLIGSYAVTLVIGQYLFRRELAVAALQALAIGAPFINFVGVPVLGNQLHNSSAASKA
jgi:predicted permease